jgi:hypothetical protein
VVFYFFGAAGAAVLEKKLNIDFMPFGGGFAVDTSLAFFFTPSA